MSATDVTPMEQVAAIAPRLSEARLDLERTKALYPDDAEAVRMAEARVSAWETRYRRVVKAYTHPRYERTLTP